jgi:hypothetical protein
VDIHGEMKEAGRAAGVRMEQKSRWGFGDETSGESGGAERNRLTRAATTILAFTTAS